MKFRTIEALLKESDQLRRRDRGGCLSSLLHRRTRGRRYRRRRPWLLVVLSAVVVIRRLTRRGRRQLRGERTDQYLVGIGVDVNLLACQGDGQTGGMSGQFAAGLLGGGGDFLLGGQHHFANILFGGFQDAGFLGVGFLFRGGLHLSDFYIQLAEAILDVRQAAIRILAGSARFFQSPL